MRKTFTGLVLRPHQKETALVRLCEKKLHAPCRYFRILKKSLDARDKSDIRWVYSVECGTEPYVPAPRVFERVQGRPRVVIAGAGPAGLFCALRLLDYGFEPVIFERGKKVEERAADVEKFCATGVLDPDSNVQFGEGGAGAFSDGKLNTQTNDARNRDVLETFVRFGAPEEVAYLGKPHVGSDRLKQVVAAMRREIEARGGSFRFGEQITDVRIRDGRIHEIVTGSGVFPCETLVLAIGHSARDTFEMLLSRGFVMQQKEFAVGVRIEHLQSAIGRAQYGTGYAALPAADYKLVSHASERAVFTFCMCPGGVVIPAASEEGGVVTNGMSDFARAGRNANSALVVQVFRSDFGSEHPLAGVQFQRKLERAAFAAAGVPVWISGAEFSCFSRPCSSFCCKFSRQTAAPSPPCPGGVLRFFTIKRPLKTVLVHNYLPRTKGFIPDAISFSLLRNLLRQQYFYRAKRGILQMDLRQSAADGYAYGFRRPERHQSSRTRKIGHVSASGMFFHISARLAQRGEEQNVNRFRVGVRALYCGKVIGKFVLFHMGGGYIERLKVVSRAFIRLAQFPAVRSAGGKQERNAYQSGDKNNLFLHNSSALQLLHISPPLTSK